MMMPRALARGDSLFQALLYHKGILKMTFRKRKEVIVAVSGGFDPIHIGHVRLFQEAKKLGDELVIILNNDNWLRAKKQHVFMPEQERKEIIESIKGVNRVVLTRHVEWPADMGVAAAIMEIKPHIFGKGGDRNLGDVPIPGSEVDICRAIGCEIVYNLGDGGKIQSSSWLLSNYLKKVNGGRD